MTFFAGSGCAQTPCDTFSEAVLLKKWLLVKTSGQLSPDRLLPGKVTVLFHKSVAGWRIPASLCTKPQLSSNFHWDSICCGFARQAPQFLQILTKFHCSELLPSSVDEERLRECPATFQGPCPPKVVFDQVQTQLQWQMYLQIKLMYFADKRIRILPTYVVKGLSSH